MRSDGAVNEKGAPGREGQFGSCFPLGGLLGLVRRPLRGFSLGKEEGRAATAG